MQLASLVSMHMKPCCRLENGAEVLIQDSDGNTALHKACNQVRDQINAACFARRCRNTVAVNPVAQDCVHSCSEKLQGHRDIVHLLLAKAPTCGELCNNQGQKPDVETLME